MQHRSIIWLALPALALLLIHGLVNDISFFLAFLSLPIILLLVWKPMLGLYFMVFFIPLEDILVIGPSFTLIKFIGMATFWGWLMHLLAGKRVFKAKGFFILLAMYIAWCALSIFWALQPEPSTLRIFTLLQVTALLLLGYNLIDSKREVHTVLLCYFIGALISAFIGIYNGYINDFAIRSVINELQNPNHYARVLCLGIIFGSYLFLQIKKLPLRIFCLMSSFVMLGAVLLSGSRGAWLALFATLFLGMLYYLKYVFKRPERRRLLTGMLVVLLAVGIISTIIAARVPSVVSQRVQEISQLVENRGTGRLDIWLVGLEVVKDHYLLGVGVDNFPYAYTQYVAKTTGTVLSMGINKNPHNIYLATLAELGIPGLLLILLLFIALWRMANRCENIADTVLCKLLICFIFLAGLTASDQHRKFFWLAMMIPLILSQFGVLKGFDQGPAQTRLLFLTPFFPSRNNPSHGIFALRLVQNLKAAGISATVVAPVPYAPLFLWLKRKWRSMGRTPRVDNLEDVHIVYPRFPCLPGGRFHFLNAMFMNWSVLPLIKMLNSRGGFNVLHSYGLLPAGFAGSVAAANLNLGSVCTVIGADINVTAHKSQRMQRLAGYVLERTDQVVAVGQNLADKAKELQEGAKQIKVIYNGVDSKVFDTLNIGSVSAKEKLGFQPDARVILYVGRIIRQKGVYQMVEAFNQIAPQYKEAVLAIVGDGEDKDSLGSLVADKGLKEQVRFIGPVPHKDLVWWYGAAEMVVLLSSHDGVPNVLKEAMSCGRPVIATRVPGISEIVADCKTGILVDPGEAGQASAAMGKLLEAPGLAAAMGNEGRAMIWAGILDWKKTAAAYQEVYTQVIDKCKSNKPI